MSNFYQIIFGFLATMAFITMVDAWINAHATFYHDPEKGACGYDTSKEGYGLETTALSTVLFDKGATCGACFEIQCEGSKWCKPGAGTIKVTATNFCPPSNGPAAWCNPPYKHFDLTLPMFLKIAVYQAGIVPVQYRRIRCIKQGGVKFLINGNPYFLLVLVFDVAGAGDVTNMKIKGSDNKWVPMKRNWGMNWQVGYEDWVSNESLSFQVTTSDGKTLKFINVVPPNWKFGMTFEGKSNF
ncbi:expansin-A25-like [Spinacia oleracea]|uniref:Expansin n=1 Tax=Spinacia oleracea TaxID=3562 RepID=A0A9R0JX11_SPIOL|nr:expansin-A25-like [Spinacia oleracea]